MWTRDKTMNRLTVMLALVMFTALSLAATKGYSQDAKPAGDANKKEGEEEEVADLGIPADFNAYLKKLYPDLDPGGEHDLFNLKNYTNKEKRFHYTVNMTQLLLEYMKTLGMGSTISKLFDQYSRGKQGNQPTFKVLHAIEMMYYPPGQPNVVEAQKLLREAAEKAPDFSYPWFVLAQFEYARFTGAMQQGGDVSPRAVLQMIDKTLEIRPEFLRAVLLKGQVYMQAKPPRTSDVRELIEPWMVTSKLPASAEDFEDALRLYIASHKAEEFFVLVGKFAASSKLSARQRVAMEIFAGEVSRQTGKVDEAIGHLEEAIKFADPTDNPAAAMSAHRSLSLCWFIKASDLRQKDPELTEDGNKTKFDEFRDAARKENLTCAEIESEHMPLTLRGTAAGQYAQFIWKALAKTEDAKNWLDNYLEKTDLSTAHRNQLENLSDLIAIELDPTEAGLIKRYMGQVERDEMEELANSLGLVLARNQQRDEHFKEQASLNFFLSQLDNRNRLVVEFAALLAADTALQIGGEQVAKTADAIADRFEKETELNSDSQAHLQENLCKAIQLTGVRTAQKRGVEKTAKLIETSQDNIDIRTLMKGQVNVWKDPAFLGGFTPAVDEPSRTALFRPRGAIDWLVDELAVALQNEIDQANAKDNPGEDDGSDG